LCIGVYFIPRVIDFPEAVMKVGVFLQGWGKINSRETNLFAVIDLSAPILPTIDHE
jgi:hypothetical protein